MGSNMKTYYKVFSYIWKQRVMVISAPEKAYVIERFGVYEKTLGPGVHFLVPVMHQVAYEHSLKPETVRLSEPAYTGDDVNVTIIAVVCMKINAPVKASYAVDEPVITTSRWAGQILRNQISKVALSRFTREQEKALNKNVQMELDEKIKDWGMTCVEFSIVKIIQPREVEEAMDEVTEAKFMKAAKITGAEAKQQETIDNALQKKKSIIFAGQAKAERIMANAAKIAKEIAINATELKNEDRIIANSVMLAEEYVGALTKLAKPDTLLVLRMPSDPDPVGGNNFAVMKEAESKGKSDNKQAVKKDVGKKRTKKGKATKDPNKPKRPANAFFIFMENFWKDVKEMHLTIKVVTAVSKAGGDKWTKMSEAEKAPFFAEAEKRKSEYEKNMLAYNKKQAEEKESDKSKSEVKDLNRLKRPANAFFVFMEDFRKELKEKHPNIKSVAVVEKAGSDVWKKMSEAEKAPFFAEAEKRRSEYVENIMDYIKKQAEGADAEEEEQSQRLRMTIDDDDGEFDN